VGEYNRDIKINPKEVEDSKWIKLEDLKLEIDEYPDKYTPWFKIIINKYF